MMRILTALLAACGCDVCRRVEMPTAADHERLYGAEPEPVDVGLGIHHCKSCQRDRAAVESAHTGFAGQRVDVILTFECGHHLAFTAEAWERERGAAVARRAPSVQLARPLPEPPPWPRAGDNGPEPVDRRPEPTAPPPRAKE